MTAKDIQQIINSVLIKNGEQEIDDFVFGELVETPNTRGTFEIKNAWFVYEADERNVKSISGPFYDTDAIYACVKLIHKSKFFEEYKFGKEAKTVYMHSHYRRLKEAEASLQTTKSRDKIKCLAESLQPKCKRRHLDSNVSLPR